LITEEKVDKISEKLEHSLPKSLICLALESRVSRSM
jgi:hypothetical protein